MDINRTTLAVSRLRAWSDPKASGNPTKRMTKIWRGPIEMAQDIHVLLGELAKVRGE